MKIPSYYSPSQANKFYSDREEYYRMYLSDNRPDRIPQTEAMAVGGTFDSHLKRVLAVKYYGKDDPRCADEFSLENMLAGNVEANLDRERLAGFGRALFDRYHTSGAYARLIEELDRMDGPESLLMEQTLYYNAPGGYTLMGKPDILFSVDGLLHVYDAKVNGFFSKSGASPLAGHVWKYPGGTSHKNAVLGKARSGVVVDASGAFHPEYLRQVTVYAMAMEGNTGEFVGGIEQVACRPMSSRWAGGPPIVRDGVDVAISFASVRGVVLEGIKSQVLSEFDRMHECITSGWVFDYLSRDESDEICARLDNECLGLAGEDKDDDFNSLVRR